MADQSPEACWRPLLDLLRGRPADARTLLLALRSAKTEGLQISPKALALLARRLGPNYGQWFLPANVVDLMCGLAAEFDPESVLDPWCGTGVLLSSFVQGSGPKTATGIYPNPEIVAVAEELDEQQCVVWRCEEPLEALRQCHSEFDVVLSALPLGYRRQIDRKDDSCGRVRTGDYGSEILLESSLRLTEDGAGVFLVLPRLGFDTGPRSVRRIMSDLGLHLDAYVSIPEGSLAPTTSVSAGVAVVRRKERTQVFVGQLSVDSDKANAQLLANYASRSDGRLMPLGRCVPVDDFQGYEVLDAWESVRRLGTDAGELVTLGSIAMSVSFQKKGHDPDFRDEPNCVYVPLVGFAGTTADKPEPGSRPTGWVQVALDPEVASARFVARFLESPLGVACRKTVMSGATVPRLSRGRIDGMPVYLPPLDTQLRLVEADLVARQVVASVEKLRAEIWQQPAAAERAVAALSRHCHGEDEVGWIESQPYPIATILWAERTATTSPRRQLEYRLHFFEALAEFLSTVLISALARDEARFVALWPTVLDELDRMHLRLDPASFGTWTTTYSALAKRFRALLNADAEGRAACHAMFCTPGEETIGSLCSKRLVGVLQQANSIRNKKWGHGGVPSDEVCRLRVKDLAPLLMDAREALVDAWLSFEMLVPGHMTYRDGVFTGHVKRAMGAHFPFETREVDTTEPLDVARLYLADPRERSFLKLASLIKIMPSPVSAENACYFYSRTAGEQVTLVSHHFEREDQTTDAFPDVMRTVQELAGRTGPAGQTTS